MWRIGNKNDVTLVLPMVSLLPALGSIGKIITYVALNALMNKEHPTYKSIFTITNKEALLKVKTKIRKDSWM